MIFLTLIPSIACFLAAFYLALKGKEGWGWFLFVSCVLGSTTIEWVAKQ